MRKYDFAWVLPLAMAAVVLSIGLLLMAAAGLISIVPSAALAATEEEQFGCGVVPRPNDSLTAQFTQQLPLGVDSAQFTVIQAGEVLFTNNCAQCHAINDVVVGPALSGITERRTIAWLVPWVKNPSKVVASGDEYAVKIFNQYQKQQMPSFPLSEAEIKSIIAYVEAESSKWIMSGCIGYGPAAPSQP